MTTNEPNENASESDLIEARNLVLSVCELKQSGNLPEPRVGARLSTIGPKCLLYGGFSSNGTYAAPHLLEIEKTTWKAMELNGAASLPPLFGHSMTRICDDIYIFGGAVSKFAEREDRGEPPSRGFSISSDLLILHILSSDVTVVKTDLPTPRMYHADLLISSEESPFNADVLLIHGGFDGAQILDDMYLLLVDEGRWLKVDVRSTSSVALPGPRFGHTLTWISGGKRAILLGGNQDDECRVFSLEFALDEDQKPFCLCSQISSRSSPPSSRIFHSTVQIRPKWLFIFGGIAVDYNAHPYVFDLESERWRRPIADGDLGLKGHAATQLMDKLLVYSGAYESRASNESATISSVRELTPQKAIDLVLTPSARLTRKLLFCTVLELRGAPRNSQLKFKIVTVGDAAVGKSCLLLRFVSDTYHEMHMATIGAGCSSIVTLVAGKLVTLQLWDTAGQERFAGLMGSYFRDADGLAIVFDLTKRSTFDHVEDWLEIVKEHHPLGPNVGIVLIGNKSDLRDQQVVTHEEATRVAAKLGGIYVATSARTAECVDQAFLELAGKLVTIRQKVKWKEIGSETVQLGTSTFDGSASQTAACMGLQRRCYGGGGYE